MSLERLSAERIALIKPSALGDIVHALPVLTALRVRFPSARITWVVNATYEPLLRNHPDLTDTLPFDRSAFKRAPWHIARYAIRFFGIELRRRQFDLVIDLQGLFRSGLMCLASRAPQRIGLSSSREGSRLFYTNRVTVPDRMKTHAVDRNWAVAEAFGVGDIPKRFHVPIDPRETVAAMEDLAGLPRPWLAVAVGAKWVTKRWPPAHFTALLRRALASVGGTCLFVGSADDSVAAQEVMHGLGGPARDLTGRTALPRLAAVLASCDAMVGNDTGPLHLASALGIPCVAPYTCTKVQLHGPYGCLGGGVETKAPCGGSYRKTCPDMVCMPELTPDRVWPALSEVLNSWTLRRRTCPSA